MAAVIAPERDVQIPLRYAQKTGRQDYTATVVERGQTSVQQLSAPDGRFFRIDALR